MAPFFLAGFDANQIATFDAGGVSGHPNHLDTAAGVRSVIQSLPDGVNVFELETTNIVRKYSGPLDIFLSYFCSASTTSSSATNPTIAASSKPWVSYLAMQAHHSQFVWFRHLFVAFSRYTFVNSWRAIGERSTRKSS